MEVLVLAGYRAQKEGELSLAPGDVVRQVCKGPARGWLRGELGGHCGLFPERLVQEIPETLRGAGEEPRPRCARSRVWLPNLVPECLISSSPDPVEIFDIIKEPGLWTVD